MIEFLEQKIAELIPITKTFNRYKVTDALYKIEVYKDLIQQLKKKS